LSAARGIGVLLLLLLLLLLLHQRASHLMLDSS
jgi:hypothetical protein